MFSVLLKVKTAYYRQIFNTISLLLYLCLGTYAGYAQISNRQASWYSAIQDGNMKTISVILDSSDVNTVLTKDSLTPLVLAIKTNRPEIVKFLLKIKADPNARCKGLTPLMYACQEKSKRQIRLLITSGASVNEVDSVGNTPLMFAATSQPQEIARLLLSHGASLNARNDEGLTARDIAGFSDNRPTLNYLKSVFESHLPNYSDGPYALYHGKKKIKILYFKHDSLRRHTNKYISVYNLSKKKGLMKGFSGDTITGVIKTKYTPESSVFSGVEKIYVIGDIHGQCDSLKKFLINNRITDQYLKWNFGNGHLVFLGDIFDRGEQVTDVLWLIYRLEHEAGISGGKVHFLLGNHEFMVFSHITKYLSDKYYYLFDNLHLDYSKYYGSETVLGRWLRSKNIMLKINNILFVHGGIHPDFLKYEVPIDSANLVIHQYLNSKNKEANNTLLDFLLSESGPLWYRGMIPSEDIPDRLSEKKLNHILNYLGVDKVMVGHTNQTHITSYYSGKVYGLDIPFYYYHGNPMEAMYIDPTGYYRVFTNGEKKKIE